MEDSQNMRKMYLRAYQRWAWEAEISLCPIPYGGTANVRPIAHWVAKNSQMKVYIKLNPEPPARVNR